MTKDLTRVLAMLLVGAAINAPAFAEGDPAPTYQRELAMQRYKGCHFTDEMGQYLYQCVKKNDGFGTHWCYDETLEVYCPDQLAARKTDESVPSEAKPASN